MSGERRSKPLNDAVGAPDDGGKRPPGSRCAGAPGTAYDWL